MNFACDDLATYEFVVTFVEQYQWYKFDAKVLSLVQQDNLYTLTLVFNTLLKEQGSGPELALSQQGNIASYQIKLPILDGIDNTSYQLVTIAIWDTVMSSILGCKWQPKKILVAGINNKKSKHLVINTLPVQFGQAHNAIEFDSSLIFEKLVMKVEKRKEMVKTYSDILGNVAIDSLTQSVIEMIIQSGDVSIERVAAILGSNPRMLQLKLKKRDTSFSTILTATRIKIAKAQLKTTSFKVSEIANDLAFSSSEAFVRFFKKSEGESPLRWRKNLL